MTKWHEVTWYSKLGAALLFFGIIPMVSFYIGIKYREVQYQIEQDQLLTPPFNDDSTKSNNVGTEKIADNSYLNGIKSFTDEKEIIISDNQDTSILFRGTVEKARNPGSYVYVNGKKVGSVEGIGIVDDQFSSDKKLFYFSTAVLCGADCIRKNDYEINIPVQSLIVKRYNYK